jgi:preprotein translocase subunit SecF
MNIEDQSADISMREFLKLLFLIGCGVFVILTLVYFLKKDLDSRVAKTKSVAMEVKVIVPPADVRQALDNLKNNIGSVEEQRQDIDKISKALKDGTATTRSLGQKGNTWLHDFRRKVEVREAIIAWQEIQKMNAEFAKSPKWVTSNSEKKKGRSLETAEKLAKIVSAQIESPYARVEGFEVSHGELYDSMYPLRNGGKKRE